MSAFIIANLKVLDHEKLQRYSAAAGPIVASFGGEFLAKGPATPLHRKTEYPVTVVIRFQDVETAKAWYNSAEYQQIIPLRNEAFESRFQVIG